MENLTIYRGLQNHCLIIRLYQTTNGIPRHGFDLGSRSKATAAFRIETALMEIEYAQPEIETALPEIEILSYELEIKLS